MEKHINIVAALHVALGMINILIAGVVFLALVGGGVLSGELQALAITGIIGFLFAVFLSVISLPGILGGIGLFYRKNWARILMIVISILNLFSFPIGTLISVYTLWVLLNDETGFLFAEAERLDCTY